MNCKDVKINAIWVIVVPHGTYKTIIWSHVAAMF